MTRVALLGTLWLVSCAAASARPAPPASAPCSDGSAASYHERARQLEHDDPAASQRALRCGCVLGHAESCYDLAVQQADAGDVSRAVVNYEAACSHAHYPACYNLGTCFVSGPCVADPARGADLLRRACDGGVPHACLNLGNSYVLGRGVERRPERARPLLGRACDAGVALACYNLAVLLTDGTLAADEAAAAALRARACDGGIEDACEP